MAGEVVMRVGGRVVLGVGLGDQLCLISALFMLFFFFFQAEDGIRDIGVMEFRRVLFRSLKNTAEWKGALKQAAATDASKIPPELADKHGKAPEPKALPPKPPKTTPPADLKRSEERRVGKECRTRWAP